MNYIDSEFFDKKEASILRNILALVFFSYIVSLGVRVMLLQQGYDVKIVYSLLSLLFIYAVLHEILLGISRLYVVIKIESSNSQLKLYTYYTSYVFDESGFSAEKCTLGKISKKFFEELRLTDIWMLKMANGKRFIVRDKMSDFDDLIAKAKGAGLKTVLIDSSN